MQILTRDHDKAVIDIIRANVDDYDEYNNLGEESDDDDEEDDAKIQARPRGRPRKVYERPLKVGDHLVLGSPQNSVSIERAGISNPICDSLHILLNNYFEEVDIRTSAGKRVKVTPQDQVSSICMRGVQ